MFGKKVAPSANSFHVEKPPGASLQHAVDSLLSLRLPRPEGFVAKPGKSHLSLFLVGPNDPLGPIGYSTATRRLFCYKAAFRDGAMAVMVITGEALSHLLRDRSLQSTLTEIHGEAVARGGIEKHALCSVRTPLSQRHSMEFVQHHLSQVVLQSMIQNELVDQAGGHNYLDIKCVELAGWSHNSSSLPQCYVERASGKSSELNMRFAWARGEPHSATVSF
jgi:hypothetical protein